MRRSSSRKRQIIIEIRSIHSFFKNPISTLVSTVGHIKDKLKPRLPLPGAKSCGGTDAQASQDSIGGSGSPGSGESGCIEEEAGFSRGRTSRMGTEGRSTCSDFMGLEHGPGTGISKPFGWFSLAIGAEAHRPTSGLFAGQLGMVLQPLPGYTKPPPAATTVLCSWGRGRKWPFFLYSL